MALLHKLKNYEFAVGWKLVLLIAVFGLSLVAFAGYVNRSSDPDRLFADLINNMKTGRYEDIYANSADLLHLNVDHKNFKERMTDALEKMRKADGNLNFVRDKDWEQRNAQRQRESDKAVGRKTPNDLIFVFQELGTGDDKVTVLLMWQHKGLFPEFVNLSVMPNNSERRDLFVKGILYTE